MIVMMLTIIMETATAAVQSLREIISQLLSFLLSFEKLFIAKNVHFHFVFTNIPPKFATCAPSFVCVLVNYTHPFVFSSVSSVLKYLLLPPRLERFLLFVLVGSSSISFNSFFDANFFLSRFFSSSSSPSQFVKWNVFCFDVFVFGCCCCCISGCKYIYIVICTHIFRWQCRPVAMCCAHSIRLFSFSSVFVDFVFCCCFCSSSNK